jgi:hypothetical protein
MQEIAEAFSRHQFHGVYPHLGANVRWNIVGEAEIVGRDVVIAACEDSAAYLATVSTTFRSLRTYAGPAFVVVDAVAEYIDPDGDRSVVASCDIYQYDGGTLSEITSYTVELEDVDE